MTMYIWNQNKNKKTQVQHKKIIKNCYLNQTEEVHLYGNKQQI